MAITPYGANGANNVNTTKATSGNGAERAPSSSLGKDEFLKILVMQLANQDPLEPVKDTEFIAQMAQFSSLEQMQQLNNSFGTLQAYQMIGKTVVANTMIDGQMMEITGVVEGVARVNGVDYLQVGEYLVLPSAVLGAFDSDVFSDGVLKGADLVGKNVEAIIPKKDGAPGETETIQGKVEEIIIRGKNLFVKINGQEIPMGYITRIFAGEIPKPDPVPDPEPPQEGGDTGDTEGDKDEVTPPGV